MQRRQLLNAIAMATVSSSFFYCGTKKEREVEKPNIIFILADDLGYGDLGCYGQEKIKTPNIDHLAIEGIRFTQCYAGATVCAPSRSVFMTGLHTGHTRVRGNMCKVGGTEGYKNNRKVRRMNLLDEDITTAQVLHNAGYRTCLVGKWHLGGYNKDAGPLERGFDEFYGGLTITSELHQPAYWPAKWYKNRELMDILPNQNGQKGYYRTAINTDNAIQFIKDNQDNPFFLFLSYSNPHSPYDAPESEIAAYENMDWPIEEKTYAAMIHFLDFSVGRIKQTLKELKLDKKTILFFSSDNGPRSEAQAVQSRVIDFFNSNGPLKGYKRDLYDGGIRVPMIVKWPDFIPKGATCDTVWYFADFLPTVMELAGSSPSHNIDGISIVPYLLNPKKKMPDRFLYWEFFERGFQQAVRWKDWKAIRLKPGVPLYLFDLATDPGEENDVADKYPQVIQEIEEYLKTARTDSPNWPVEAG
jgi:arylsulfatase A-like enzyme